MQVKCNRPSGNSHKETITSQEEEMIFGCEAEQIRWADRKIRRQIGGAFYGVNKTKGHYIFISSTIQTKNK